MTSFTNDEYDLLCVLVLFAYGEDQSNRVMHFDVLGKTITIIYRNDLTYYVSSKDWDIILDLEFRKNSFKGSREIFEKDILMMKMVLR